MKQDLLRLLRASSLLKGGMCLALTCTALPVFAAESSAPLQAAAPQGQTKTLTGTVYDENGEPVIGASVMVKGTSIGAATDIEGQFTLNVPLKGTLIVSYVGYVTKEIQLNGQTNLDINLTEDTASLDELVVVGYGVQKKATLTGSVSSVGGEEIKKVSAANLTNTLAGKTAGIIANTRSGEPGEDGATITIRGKGTLGNTEPLIIVDGIADRSFSRLNPDDIESISVLKDASAAIYGARAANGVILVTTKRGKEGKVKVNYNGSYTWAQPTRIPKMLNSYQYATYRNEYAADSRHGGTSTFDQSVLDHYQNHDDLDAFPDTDWWGVTAKDWAGRTQHSVSVSGGNEKVSFYSSFQYMWQDALYRKSAQDYNQFQITSNVDAKISKAISFSFDILGRQENRNRGVYSTEDVFGKLLTMFPGAAPYYSNGLPRIGYDGIQNNTTIMVSTAPGYNRYKYHILDLKPKVRVDLDVITKGLYAEAYAALDFNFNYGKQLNRPYDAYTIENGEYVNKRDMTGKISVSDWSDHSLNETYNIRLGYNREFAELHKVNAFVAYEQNKYSYHSLSGYRTNFLSDQIPELFAGSDVPEDKDNGGYSDVTTRRNVFGRINYDYDGKYLAEVTMRYDGSMNFAKKHRWGFFPAFSLGWVISQEKFFERLNPAINFLKIKFSWGKMGNDNISPYQYLSQYKFGQNADNTGTGAYFGAGADGSINKGFYLDRVANPLVTWESARTMNVGFSANFLNNMFGLDFDWFHSVRDDILWYRNASVPYFSGMKLPAENLGKVTNSGIEIVATYRDSAGDFSWNVTGNFTYARNKVNYIDEAPTTPKWQRQEGTPIDGNTMYKAIGIYQNWDQVNSTPHMEGAAPGDLIYFDTNDDGVITWDDTQRFDYSPTPRIIYGLTLSAEWKGIDLSLFFQGQAQAKQLVMPTMNMAVDFYNGRWREGNTEEQNLKAKWPKAFIGQTYGDTWNGQESTWWLRNAAFCRLKSLEIGYTLPRKWWGNSGIDNIRIYFNGSNLFTIDDYKIADPEVGNAITSYPLQRSLTFGAGITF